MLSARYPEKYKSLIDDETWEFIEKTNSYFPADAVDLTIEQQREIYNKMCQAFHAGHPNNVVSSDNVAEWGGQSVPTRSYRVTETEPLADVVYYHGGGFVVGGLDSHDDVCAEICGTTGFTVTSVDYRLAPEHRFPDDFNDAMAAFHFIASQTSKPIILVGDSAGANLAASVAHHTRSEKKRPSGQVLIYPGLGSDLTWGTFVEHAEAPMLTTKDTTFYKTARTGGDDGLLADARCTPLNDLDFSKLPNTVVVSAQCDPLSGDGDAYCQKILAAGGNAHWHNEIGLVHGFLRARHSVTRAKASFSRITDAISALGSGQWPY